MSDRIMKAAALARSYIGHETHIDIDAELQEQDFSVADDGIWVKAWVFVENEELDDVGAEG